MFFTTFIDSKVDANVAFLDLTSDFSKLKLSKITFTQSKTFPFLYKRWWLSGTILACHAGGPGSIPGQRTVF